MKRILSFILTFAMMLSVIGSIVINPETAYARKGGVDINGNKLDHTDIFQPTDDPVFYYQPPVDENGNHDYFGYKMYDDPMDITDEEFFGTWDSVTEMWISGPYFRYSEFPELAAVEEAAKKGDYATAKVELYNYYMYKTDRGTETYSASLDYPLALEMMSRNVFSYTKSSALDLGPFTLPADEFGKAEIDVSRAIKETPGSFAEFNVEISSADKYWTTGEIYSREAEPELRPVLRIVVNGIVTERYPSKDTTIIAGSKKNNNFGFESVLKFQEHGCYDDCNAAMDSYDEDTMRAFMAFDLSDLKSTDKITSAKIILTGRSIITDETRERFKDENGNPYSGESREKLMWATWYKSSVWNEDELVWNSSTISDKHFFSCHDMNSWDFITPSSPEDKGKVCMWQRGNMQSDLINGYQYYNDERYAYTSLRYYMAMINSIGVDRNIINSLDVSTCASTLASGIHILKTSKYMTPEIMTTLIKYAWMLADHEVEVWFGYYTNNWATYASGCVYNVLSYFPELVTHDYWYQRVLEENDRVLSGATFEDGRCIEIPQGYVTTLLGTFRTPLDTYNHLDCLIPFSEELYEDMYNCIKTLLYTTGPFLGGFNIADASGFSTRIGTYRTWYNLLFSNDEELLWVISGGTSGKMPENATTNYPVALETYMRSGWDEKSLQMSFINNTNPKISHEHNDALSVAMFAYGKYLLVDPGYGNDQTSDGGRVWDYNRSPIQHNLMTINDVYDYIIDGVCSYTKITQGKSWQKDYESNMAYDFIEYGCDGFSTAKTMQRSVTFMKNQRFWIISDYGVPKDPDATNLFAQHWHFYPQANPTHDENNVVSSNHDDVNVMVVPLEKDEVDEVLYQDGYYGEETGQKTLHKKAVITKSKTGAGRFTTVVIPVDVDEDFEVETSELENKNNIDSDLLNMVYFRITETNTDTTNYYYYYHINDASKKPEDGVKVSNFTTDATTMVIQLNANEDIVSIFVVDGSYIKDSKRGDEYLFKADEKTTVSFTRNGQFVNVLSSLYDDAEDVANMQLYMPNVMAARLDGEDVVTDIEEGTITFKGEYGASGNLPSSGGSGGGGGVAVKPPVVDDENKDDTNDNKEENVENNPVVTPVTPSYSDVKENDWYFEYVEELTEKGVVSGGGEGKFNPTDNVTREQFLKMLIEAADIEAEEAENVFADVLSNAWYKPYVLKAKNFGIVNGISETEFGIGANITRQDMAVMISRVIDKLEVESEKTDVDVFADSEKAADYAKDSVMLMKAIGLIEGYNNEFRPTDNLTRAEAAKVISELLKML